MLGVLFAHGTGAFKNAKEAVKYYKLAADQRHPSAQFNLGVCYKTGIGVTKNKQEAVRLYTLAAESG